MTSRIDEIAGARCLFVSETGARISDAHPLVEEALGERVRVICVPASRLDPSVFLLSSGVAGEMIQKVINYRMAFAVIGDISAHVAASDALRHFVRECDRGREVIFAPDAAALEARLAASAGASS